MNLFFDFDDKASVYDIHEVNSSFASGSLKVLYLGENRNGSFFTKDAVERALPSLKNVPIVCHWDYESREIGGHDVDVVSDADGNLALRNLTEPCGVVPEHASFSFVTDTDESGVEHEYLVIDGVLLWKRQDVYKHIVDDLKGHVKHSMEITVFGGETLKSGLFNIQQFEFTALCLLERDDPCFQGSELNLYSINNFKAKMEEMMAELKEYYTVNADNSADEYNNSTEGGKDALDNANEIEVINDNTEPVTQDDVEVFASADEDSNTESEPVEAEPASETEFALTSGIVDELNRTISAVETVDMPWGATPRYWYVDCDVDANKVYCYDTNDWLLYGFDYVVNGDAVAIDIESKKRMKYAIVPFEGAEQSSPLASAFAAVSEQYVANDELEAKYAEASNSISEMTAELESLRQFKADIEAERVRKEKEALFSNFADLAGVEAFDELVANADNFDLTTLEEKCFAIRGRNASVAKFALDTKPVKLVVSAPNRGAQDNSDNDPYGGIVAKYSNKFNN